MHSSYPLFKSRHIPKLKLKRYLHFPPSIGQAAFDKGTIIQEKTAIIIRDRRPSVAQTPYESIRPYKFAEAPLAQNLGMHNEQALTRRISVATFLQVGPASHYRRGHQ